MDRFPEKLRIDVTNRLKHVHRTLVERIAERDFDPQELQIQNIMLDFCQEIVADKPTDYMTSFVFHNDDDDWQTHLTMREQLYSSNQIACSFIKFVGNNRCKALNNELRYDRWKLQVNRLLSDTSFCSCLYVDKLRNFIVTLGYALQDTHHFAVSIVKDRRAVQISMRDRLGRNMVHFWTRDLLHIEQEQSKIFRLLSGDNAAQQLAVHH